MQQILGFIRSEIQRQARPWGFRDVLFLGICVAFAVLLLSRTTGLLFEKDDLRYLWWAHTHQSEPWQAFVEPPLFADYYRPVVSLVWWLHWTVFQASPFAHQIAFGMWWLAILVLMYLWGRNEEGELSGLFPGLVFLSVIPIQNVLVWKSWLTVVCELTFFLSALLCLRSLIKRPSKKKWTMTFVFFLAACLCKESALLSLPFTFGTLILVSQQISLRQRIALLLPTFILAGALFVVTPTLKRFIFEEGKVLLGPAYVFDSISYYASVIWSSLFLKAVGFFVVSYHLYMAGKKWLPGTVAFCVLSVFAYILARNYNVSSQHALSLGLMVYFHGLWISPRRKRLAVPLVWFMITFWALPAIRLKAIAYAMDTAVAFSLLLGLAIYHALEYLWREEILIVDRPRRLVPVAGLLILCLLLPCSIYASMRDFFGWAGYVEVAYHDRARVVLRKVIDDLAAFKSWPVVYMNLGYRIGLETNLALILAENKTFEVHFTPPPANSYRLEAYTGANYHCLPSDEPFHLWLAEPVGPPPTTSFQDPYFMPERWESRLLTSCDNVTGWFPAGEYTHGVFPLGQGLGYVVHKLDAPGKSVDLNLRLSQAPEFLKNSPEFALTFWLQTARWDAIDSVSTLLSFGERRILWERIDPELVNTFYDWRRVVLLKSESNRTERIDPPVHGLEWRLSIQTREVPFGIGADIGVDEIRIAVPKGF